MPYFNPEQVESILNDVDGELRILLFHIDKDDKDAQDKHCDEAILVEFLYKHPTALAVKKLEYYITKYL